ncbi:hypothetical protein EWM64_g5740 [Hericium alpestre]|uniref:Cytochrome P450 n=1 Tax=Hericium alpestre TaxID=135208 RepID=A0A4Y9ZWJ0_9AGAM|nr:hypothetical protein EWM64_g5740 [Hericium alpestre]
MAVPPGLMLVAKKLPTRVFPAAAAFIVFISVLRLGFHIYPSYWAQALLFLFLFPISLTVYRYGQLWSVLHRARARGAVLPPNVPSERLAGLDLIRKMKENDASGYFGEKMEKDTELWGNTHGLEIMFLRRVVSNEPEHVKAILATDFTSFEKGKVFFEQQETLLGTGVFNSDGEMWNKERISHFEIFNRHAEDMIIQAKERLRDGYAIDFQDLVARFTLDSATEFLFGHDFKSLSAVLVGLRAGAGQVVAARRAGEYWRLFEFWKNGIEDEMRVIDGFLRPIIMEAAQKNKGADDKGREDESLLEHMARLTQDYNVLKDETLNIMLAGRDTTSSTLTFCLYMLSQHPNVMKRLREEILSVVGDNRGPSIEELREMKYLRAVINETLRLFPVVPLNSRTSVKDTVFPGLKPGQKPWFIPKGTLCVYSIWQMHRRTDLWGPDGAISFCFPGADANDTAPHAALDFDPDRFLDARLKKYLTPNPFIFLPFNAGPRICLGQQFAYNELSFMLVRLLQAFSGVELAPDAQPAWSHPPKEWKNKGGRAPVEKIWPRSHLTLYSKGGLWVRMTEAKDLNGA